MNCSDRAANCFVALAALIRFANKIGVIKMFKKNLCPLSHIFALTNHLSLVLCSQVIMVF